MQPSHDAEGVDPREFLRPIWVHKWLILLVVVVATASAYVLSERRPDQFTASTRLFIQASEIADPLGVQPTPQQDDRGTTNQATLLQSRSVALEVARRLRISGDPATLLSAITVSPQAGSDFLKISATRHTPEDAARLANAFAQAFIDMRAATQRDRIAKARQVAARELARLPRTAATRATRETLRTQIRRYDAISGLASGSTEQVDRAVPPSVRSAPKPRRDAAFAFGLALAFAILAAYGLERIDRRVKRVGQVPGAYRAPVLAVLPHASRSELKAGLTLTDPFREAVRGLRTNLQLASLDTPIRTLLVTSSIASEGKSLVVRNLALAYHEAGMRVAMIECDLRRPTLASLMEVERAPGLTQVLLDKCSLADAVQLAKVDVSDREAVGVAVATRGATNGRPAGLGSLSVLTAGGQLPNPPTVLGAHRMKNLIETAREHNDIVIIDSPPVLGVADTLPLLALVDATLLVCRLGQTRRAAARRARESIDRIPGVQVVGVVANDVPKSELGAEGYGYGYGYGYGAENRAGSNEPF
jgi:Mrp family chromosome partitioning ATPase/capsular polysaccharide biosynthesis protein